MRASQPALGTRLATSGAIAAVPPSHWPIKSLCRPRPARSGDWQGVYTPWRFWYLNVSRRPKGQQGGAHLGQPFTLGNVGIEFLDEPQRRKACPLGVRSNSSGVSLFDNSVWVDGILPTGGRAIDRLSRQRISEKERHQPRGTPLWRPARLWRINVTLPARSAFKRVVWALLPIDRARVFRCASGVGARARSMWSSK